MAPLTVSRRCRQCRRSGSSDSESLSQSSTMILTFPLRLRVYGEAPHGYVIAGPLREFVFVTDCFLLKTIPDSARQVAVSSFVSRRSAYHITLSSYRTTISTTSPTQPASCQRTHFSDAKCCRRSSQALHCRRWRIADAQQLLHVSMLVQST